MNWNIVKGNWKQFRGEVKAHWGKLTDDPLDAIDGNQTELADKLQEEQIRDCEQRKEKPPVRPLF